jgi:ElaA protein
VHADVRWQIAPFSALSAPELYAWLRLRQRVFVEEQACAYVDADGLDPACEHLLGWRSGALIAGARLVPPGLAHPMPAIGRVVTAPEVRREGLGRALFGRALAAVHDRHGPVPVHLGAQAYLRDFYASFGFVVDGDPYDEDGIPHLPMTGRARG